MISSRGNDKAAAFLKEHSGRIIVSAITAAELYAGAENDEEIETLDEFLSLFPVVPVALELARAGGLHKRDYFKSHGIGLADAVIAATAEAHHAELKTLNVKHYPMFKGLKPPYVK